MVLRHNTASRSNGEKGVNIVPGKDVATSVTKFLLPAAVAKTNWRQNTNPTPRAKTGTEKSTGNKKSAARVPHERGIVRTV